MRHGSMNVSPSVDNILDLTLDVPSNIGTYLARRMVELGVKDYFVVPGDFNLILLDQILLFPQLQMISCCNELNAGYAADGYARVKVSCLDRADISAKLFCFPIVNFSFPCLPICAGLTCIGIIPALVLCLCPGEPSKHNCLLPFSFFCLFAWR